MRNSLWQTIPQYEGCKFQSSIGMQVSARLIGVHYLIEDDGECPSHTITDIVAPSHELLGRLK